MSPSTAPEYLPRRRAVPLLAGLAFAAATLGYAACILGGVLPPASLAWLAFAAAAAIMGSLGALALNRLMPSQTTVNPADFVALQAHANALELDRANNAEQQRRLRHDLRGALSPILLMADRLTAHADPAVTRAADIMVRTVERATELLSEPKHVSPPADP